MASVTVRDLPEETRSELAARAARSGRSMQEYLKLQLIELAERPDQEQLFAQIRERKRITGTRLSAADIIAARDADRR